MTGNLFRKEVLQAKQVSWLGDVVVASPIRFTVIAALAALVSIVVMLFLVFGTYARHSQVTGQLVPTQGISTVLAPAAGVLSSMRVLEGDTVRANQILAVIATPRTTLATLQRARTAGPNIYSVCESILQHDGVKAIRRILGVLSLAKKHGPAVVDDAAKAALEMGAPSYHFLRRYLERQPALPLTLRQVDPLIRQLTLYRDLIDRTTGDLS